MFLYPFNSKAKPRLVVPVFESPRPKTLVDFSALLALLALAGEFVDIVDDRCCFTSESSGPFSGALAIPHTTAHITNKTVRDAI